VHVVALDVRGSALRAFAAEYLHPHGRGWWLLLLPHGQEVCEEAAIPFQVVRAQADLTNKDPVEVLNQCVRDASGGRSCSWLLCDFGPPRVPLSKLSSAVWSPMSISRFASLSRQLLQMPPGQLSAEQAAGISTYSGRRLSPTLADLGQFPDTKRLKLGGWLNEELIAQQQQMAQPNRGDGAERS
jgi:hypothetical protein